MQDVFEAVYTGVHQDCQDEHCPCRILSKPLSDAADEEVAKMRVTERGLSIEEARASLLMGNGMREAIRQAIMTRGYIAGGRFWSKYSVCDLASAIMGIHPLFNWQVIEQIQQGMGLDNQTVQVAGSLTLEQVTGLATCFAQSGFSMRTITRECMTCGQSFVQFPHPYDEQAFYYTCPTCLARAYREGAALPSRHGSGIYHRMRR